MIETTRERESIFTELRSLLLTTAGKTTLVMAWTFGSVSVCEEASQTTVSLHWPDEDVATEKVVTEWHYKIRRGRKKKKDKKRNERNKRKAGR